MITISLWFSVNKTNNHSPHLPSKGTTLNIDNGLKILLPLNNLLLFIAPITNNMISFIPDDFSSLCDCIIFIIKGLPGVRPSN
ncbi:hypothetical protein FKM82_021846 [Ascaphus truei]